MGLARPRLAQDFLDRVVPASIAARPLSRSVRIPPRGRVADLAGRGAPQDRGADLVADVQDLEDPAAPAVAGVVAAHAALAEPERLAAHHLGVGAQLEQDLLVGLVASLQPSQIRRTSRCATTASSVAVIRNGSTPMSTKRVTVLDASFVCSVEKTVCPVKLASTATDAVSPSRISPIRILSGSWRSTVRSTLAYVTPMSSWIGTCTMPSMSYSTGSSVVMIFRSGWFASCSIA
jgi:hypothetical protein